MKNYPSHGAFMEINSGDRQPEGILNLKDPTLPYRLEFSEDSIVKNISERIMNQSAQESLVMVEDLSSLMRVVEGEGYEKALIKIKSILEMVEAVWDRPIIHYSAELANERLSKKIVIRSSILTMDYPRPEALTALAASRDPLEEQNISLSKRLNPNRQIPVGGKMYQVASDAVAIYDRQNVAQAAARVDFSSLPKEHEPSLTAIRNIRRMLGEGEFKNGLGLSDLVSYLTETKIIRFLPSDFFKHIETEGYLDGQLELLEAKLAKELFAAYFEDYSELSKNNGLNPFGSGLDKVALSQLQYLHRPELRKKIETDLNIDLNQIPLRSQIYLLKFLAEQNNAGFFRLRSVLQVKPDQANNILNSFLACAEDQNNTEVILALAEQLPAEVSAAVFVKFAELVAESKNMQVAMTKEFSNVDFSQESSRLVNIDLLSKANGLLKKMEEGIINPQKVVEQLSAYRGEVALYTSMAKQLVREGNVSAKDIVEKKIIIKDSADFTEAEKIEMSGIFVSGRNRSYPEGLRSKSERKFKKKINEPGHTFYMLAQGDHPLVFFYVDKETGDTLYVGGFNLSPDAEGPWAAAFAKSWLQEQLKHSNVRADVLESNSLARLFYIRNLGFKEDIARPPFFVKDEMTDELHKYINLIRYKNISSSSEMLTI